MSTRVIYIYIERERESILPPPRLAGFPLAPDICRRHQQPAELLVFLPSLMHTGFKSVRPGKPILKPA